jgi:3-oxoadipate CoA-transferase alpha subunit
MTRTTTRESWITEEDALTAMRRIRPGQTILVGGFGDSGYPRVLLEALIELGTGDLVVVSNNGGRSDNGIGGLLRNGRVRKLVTTYPVSPGHESLQPYLTDNGVEIELVPQGTLAQRLNAGAFRLGGVLTAVGLGGDLPGQESTVELDGTTYRVERPLRGDVALIAATVADPYGNLRFRRVSRNFNPVMADAAALTIAEVTERVADPIDPDDVHVPEMSVDVLVDAGRGTR